MIGLPAKTSSQQGFDTEAEADGMDSPLGDIMRGERATMGKSLLDVQRELRIRGMSRAFFPILAQRPDLRAAFAIGDRVVIAIEAAPDTA